MTALSHLVNFSTYRFRPPGQKEKNDAVWILLQTLPEFFLWIVWISVSCAWEKKQIRKKFEGLKREKRILNTPEHLNM